MSVHKSIFSILAVTLALAGARAPATAGPQEVSDQAITDGIEAQLFQDSVLKTRDIRVSTTDGVVTLSGDVATQFEKSAATRIASREHGVKKVMDALRVSGAAATAASTEKAEAAVGGASSTTASGAAPAGKGVTVPSGTVLTVRMIDSIDSKKDQPGQEFAASLNSAVVVGDRVVFPQGSDVKVRLVEAKESGHFKGKSELSLELTSVTAGGKTYPLETGYYTESGGSRGKRTAETVGGGAVVGGLIGAIAGGRKGAAIGAGVGAGTGAGVQAVTRGASVKVPSETKLDFTLKAPVRVAE